MLFPLLPGSAQPQTNAFGASNNAFGAAQPSGTGLFGSANTATSGFGAMNTSQPVPSTGTLNPPYQPTSIPEKDPHGHTTTQIYKTITCMPAYQKASLEELRLQDYLQGRKTGQSGPAASAAPSTGFGGFGNTSNTLSQPAQPAGGGLFGASANTNTGGGLFGQNNPPTTSAGTGTGLFGQTNTAGNTGGGLFGQQNKPPTTSGGLFGQTATPQPAAGGGLFGAKPATSGFGFGSNTNATASTGTGFGGFGQSSSTAPSGGGLFGGGGAFGQPQGQQQNQQQQQQPSTGFSFGQQPAQQQNNAFGANTGGGLFGQNKPAGTGLFGSSGNTSTGTGTTGTGFGGFGANNNAQANKPAFGGFGATGTSSQQGQTGGGLFGNTANQSGQSGGGLFGNTNNAAGSLGANPPAQPATGGGGLFGGGAATGTGGGLFGNNANNQAQQPPGQAGGLFGSKPPAPAGGGLFGQGATNNAGGGLFGQNNNATNAGGGLFGQNNASQPKPAFGGTGGGLLGNTGGTQPNAGATGGGLFGQNNQQQSGLGGGLFGNKPAGTQPFGQTGSLSMPGLGANTQSGGGGLFGQTNLGASQPPAFNQTQPPAQSSAPLSLTTNPYGTDAYFGSTISATDLNNRQASLPFNVAPKSAKKPPLVPSVFSSPRNATTVARLRGSTPGGSFSRGRQSSPFVDGNTSISRFGAGTPSLFRGLSDEQALSPQAFVTKPSVKRLVLNDTSLDAGNSSFSRSIALRRGRASTAQPEDRPSNRNVFSPALETSTTSAHRQVLPPAADDTFNSNASLEDTPLRRRYNGSTRATSTLPRLPSAPAPMPVPAADTSAPEHDGDLRMGYYMSPPLSELRTWAHADLAAVPNFVVGRTGYGEIHFDQPVDLTSVPDLNEIAGGVIVIRAKEVIVYPDEDEVAQFMDGVIPGFLPVPVQSPGSGLNQPATVSLDGCWARDKSTKAPVKDPNQPRYKQHLAKLKARDETFVDFEPKSGTWRFKVQHFSRYALDDDDDDEDEANGAGLPRVSTQNNNSRRSFSKPVAAGARPQASARATALHDDDDGIVDEDDEEEEQEDEDTEVAESDEAEMSDVQPRSSNPAQPVSFAEAMHVEPRRMQVMQASFFGDLDEEREPPQPQPAASAFRREPSVPAYSLPDPSAPAPSKPNLLFQPSVFKNGSAPQVAPATASPAAPLIGTARSHSSREPSATPGLGRSQSALVPSTARPNFAAKSAFSTQPRIKYVKSSMDRSVLAGAEGTWTDPVVALNGSFRPGFGFPNLLVRIGPQKDADAVTASQVKLLTLQPPEDHLAIKMLAAQLEHTIIDYVPEDGVPRALPATTLRFRDFASLFEVRDQSQESHIWRLGSALFDDLELGLSAAARPSQRQAATETRRKAALSQWLKSTVLITADGDARAFQAQERVEALIFSHLTSNDVEKATLSAMHSNLYHLATLLSQLPGDQSTREDIQEQLATWRDEGVYSLLSEDVRKLYELLAGNVTFAEGAGTTMAGDKVSDMLMTENLDWKRAFGLHLWYGTQFEEPLQQAVSNYEHAFAAAQAPLPVAPYLTDQAVFPSSKSGEWAQSGRFSRDTLYQLLKLYADPEYLLEDVILPTGYSDNATDYRLAWQLYLLISRVLGIRDFADREVVPVEEGMEKIVQDDEEVQVVVNSNSAKADQLALDLANQLEGGGHWQWAVFVLLFLELPETRTQALKNLLARAVPSLSAEQEKFIVTTLKVPRSWVALARAFMAHDRDDQWRVYQYALEGDDLAQAHKVAVRHLAPEVVVRGDRDLLKEIFHPFLSHESGGGSADEEHVPGWSVGGKIYLGWSEVSQSLPSLLFSARRRDAPTPLKEFEGMLNRITELATLISSVLLPEEEDKSSPGALTRYAAKNESTFCPLEPYCPGLLSHSLAHMYSPPPFVCLFYLLSCSYCLCSQ